MPLRLFTHFVVRTLSMQFELSMFDPSSRLIWLGMGWGHPRGRDWGLTYPFGAGG